MRQLIFSLSYSDDGDGPSPRWDAVLANFGKCVMAYSDRSTVACDQHRAEYDCLIGWWLITGGGACISGGDKLLVGCFGGCGFPQQMLFETRLGLSYVDSLCLYSQSTDHRQQGQLPETHRSGRQPLTRLMSLSDRHPHHTVWYVGSACECYWITTYTWIWLWPHIK